MHGTATKPAPRKKSRKSFWLKQLHTWHWVSSAISLVGLLLFAITGFTLNHAAEIEGSPVTVEKKVQLPAPLLADIKPDDAPDAKKPLPKPVADWVQANLPVARVTGAAEWSSGEIYLALPRPGGDGWVAIDRETGEVTNETTNRGWIAWLNDLHKGRNAGTVWKWFIDIFVVACVVFSLTGLILLQLHARHRPSTWPLVAAGLIIPAILAIYFIH